jgi:ribonuclease Z
MEVQFRYAEMHFSYSIVFHTLEGADDIILYEDKNLRISSFCVMHRLPCWGFLFEEKKPPYKIGKESVEGMGIPSAAFATLKSGQNFMAEDGQEYDYRNFTVPNTPPVSYCYITDTLFLPDLADRLRAKRIDLLYHEATFMHDLIDKAVDTRHSTARQAATFAKKAAVNTLLIGHFSSRYNDLNLLLEEAKAVFPQTWLAIEGETFSA